MTNESERLEPIHLLPLVDPPPLPDDRYPPGTIVVVSARPPVRVEREGSVYVNRNDVWWPLRHPRDPRETWAIHAHVTHRDLRLATYHARLAIMFAVLAGVFVGSTTVLAVLDVPVGILLGYLLACVVLNATLAAVNWSIYRRRSQ